MNQGVEAFPATADVGQELLSHPWLPEFLEVVYNARDRFFGGVAGEELRDLIGLVDHVRDIHQSPPTWVVMSRSSRYCLCQSDGVMVRRTSTAVTLYSGQLVAQSENSVVTTLAPVSGWWKVV